VFLAVKSIDRVLLRHRCDSVQEQKCTVLLYVDRESNEVTQWLESRLKMIAEHVAYFGVNTSAVTPQTGAFSSWGSTACRV